MKTVNRIWSATAKFIVVTFLYPDLLLPALMAKFNYGRKAYFVKVANRLIKTSDLSAPRTPLQLSDWIESKLNEAKRLPLGKKAVRSRTNLWKEFIEEVLPLSNWALATFGENSNIQLQPVIGNQPFDAIITDPDKSPPEYFSLEITQATDGYADHLRSILLSAQGSAPGAGSISVVGTEKTGRTIIANNDAISYAEHVGNALTLIENAAQKKCENEGYTGNIELLILFSDNPILQDANFEGELEKMYRSKLDAIKKPFRRIFIMGWSNKIYLTAQN